MHCSCASGCVARCSSALLASALDRERHQHYCRRLNYTALLKAVLDKLQHEVAPNRAARLDRQRRLRAFTNKTPSAIASRSSSDDATLLQELRQARRRNFLSGVLFGLRKGAAALVDPAVSRRADSRRETRIFSAILDSCNADPGEYTLGKTLSMLRRHA